MQNTKLKNRTSFLSHLSGWTNDFLSLFYPPVCIHCSLQLNDEKELICSSCISELPVTNSHLKELPHINEKFYGRIYPQHTYVFLSYRKKGITQHLFHEFKYRGNKEVATYLGELFGKELQPVLKISSSDHVLVPVPLHPTKEKSRGYNQSEEICKGLSNVLGIEVNTTSLLRRREGDSQTKRNRQQRWEHLKNVYEVVDAQLQNKHVLLVDDVLTTGATFEVCYNEIQKTNPSAISILSLANS